MRLPCLSKATICLGGEPGQVDGVVDVVLDTCLIVEDAVGSDDSYAADGVGGESA
jgi:hypothetical protein